MRSFQVEWLDPQTPRKRVVWITSAMEKHIEANSCASCSRRDFMAKLGIIAGMGAISPDLLAMLPPPVSPDLIPDKKGAVKVRLIFAYHTPHDIQPLPQLTHSP